MMLLLLIFMIFDRPFQKSLSVHINTFWVPIFLKFVRHWCLLIVVTTVLEIMFISCFIVAGIVIEVVYIIGVVARLLSWWLEEIIASRISKSFTSRVYEFRNPSDEFVCLSCILDAAFHQSCTKNVTCLGLLIQSRSNEYFTVFRVGNCWAPWTLHHWDW